MKRSILVAVVVGAIAATIAPTVDAQRVVVKAPAAVPQYDSVAITATPYDVSGKRSSSSTIRWSVNPPAMATVVVTGQHGQQASLVGQIRGSGWIKATWTRTDKKVVSDSSVLSITEPGIASLALFTKVGAAGQLLFDPQLTVGSSACVYVAGYDKRGNYLVGRHFALSTGDSTIVGLTSVGDCPDTTVSPYHIP